MKQKIYAMLGFAQRAGKLTSGEKGCEANIKKQKAKLFILAVDATETTKKNFNNMCDYYKVPLKNYGTKNELGLAIGKSPRSTIVILDKDFANSLLKLLHEAGEN